MSSVVRFNITQRTAEGARVPIVDGGRVVLEPTRLIVVEGDPDEMVIPARITVPLVDGRADVLMDATGVAWCWRIVVRGARRDPLQEGYYTIPESATPLDYPTDLVEVDPKTLVPAESAVPAWEAAVEVVQSHEDAAALAATQASGSASSAAASAQSAANSASAASGSAGTAATKATEASTSATNAASSASAANVSATNADAAKTAAAGLATSAAANAFQAANSASTASTKATEATNSATAAAASASTASTKATEASTSATNAASSAAIASAAQAATEAVDITVGTVTTGTPADAAISGDAPAFTLDLTIPRGDPGPANSLAIGTVATGAAGSSASANITGTAPEQTLNLTIPRGEVGNPTAYELRGTGMPNGVVTAPPGSYYTDTAGTNGAWRWLKTSGTGKTGWVVVYGDTGWRNIAAALNAPDWTVHTLHVRRAGSQVHLRLRSLARPGSGDSVAILPVGFRIAAIRAVPIYTSYGGADPALRLLNILTSGAFRAMSSFWEYSGATIEEVSWATSDPWPTALPGTPA